MFSQSACEKVNEARTRAANKRREFGREIDRIEAEQAEAMEYERRFIMPNLRPATREDYEEWLSAFLSNGGKITHAYDYEMPNDIFVAKSDTMLNEDGWFSSLKIIVPKGVSVTGDPGNCNLYHLADASHVGRVVPVYRDTGVPRFSMNPFRRGFSHLSPKVRELVAAAHAAAAAEKEKWQTEYRDLLEQPDDDFEDSLRPAHKRDYERWLEGHLSAGGKITHAYDYKMPESFRVAMEDMTLRPLYGARSLNIIVPEGIEVTGELGHTNLYLMKDFSLLGSCVDVYSDIAHCCCCA
jgi:hypothetical protein